jgi:hypothetical protein
MSNNKSIIFKAPQNATVGEATAGAFLEGQRLRRYPVLPVLRKYGRLHDDDWPKSE